MLPSPHVAFWGACKQSALRTMCIMSRAVTWVDCTVHMKDGWATTIQVCRRKTIDWETLFKHDSGNPSEASVFDSCMMIWEKNLTALLPKARWCEHDTSVELVVHTTLALVYEHKKPRTMGLIQFDFRNSYNLVSQSAFKWEILKHFTEMKALRTTDRTE